MKTVLLGLSFFIPAIVNAQPHVAEGQQTFRILTGNSTHRTNAVQGTSIVFEDYLPGAIKMTSGQEFVCERMNYDGFYDEVIVDGDAQDMSVKMMVILSFYVVRNSDTLFFERLTRPVNTKAGFYQLLMKGSQVRLYKKHIRRLVPAASSGAFGTGKTVPEFVSEHCVWRNSKTENRSWHCSRTRKPN
jgi:hypothetical protein